MSSSKMRFVIVCLIRGEALKFHEQLVNQINFKFKVKPQKLPAHFTIKAPFELDNVDNLIEIENICKQFTIKNSKTKLKIKGFDHFSNRVIYMPITPSNEALKINNDFISFLRNLQYLEWKRNEKGSKIFHCTVATKFGPSIYDNLWTFLQNYNPDFDCYFDNITILKYENYKWNIYKSFNF